MNKLANNSLIKSSLLGLIAIFMMACASAPVAPTEALVTAEKAIVLAEQGGARQFAGAELDEARQRLTLAERAVAAEKMVQAKRLAQEALVAAQLATARTDVAKATAINTEMEKGADALNEEMRRTGEQQ